MKAVAIDFETANELRSSPCAIGLAWIENGKVVRVEERLIRPKDMRFAGMNIAIHGITPADVADCPEFPEVWSALWPDIAGRIVFAHNAAFDMGVLRSTLTEYGRDWPCLDYLCTLKMAQAVWPELERHGLSFLAAGLGILLDHHRAASDAAACARIAVEIAHHCGAESFGRLHEAAGVSLGRLSAAGYSPCSRARAKPGPAKGVRPRPPRWLY